MLYLNVNQSSKRLRSGESERLICTYNDNILIFMKTFQIGDVNLDKL